MKSKKLAVMALLLTMIILSVKVSFAETGIVNYSDNIKTVISDNGLLSANVKTYKVAANMAYAVEGGNIYYNNEGIVTDADSGITKAVIPSKIDGVKIIGIGNNAFKGCRSLTSITIPNSVTSIGWYAFEGCGSITSITIPANVTSVDKGAFCECYAIEKLIAGEAGVNYGWGEQKNLKSVEILNGTTIIDAEAFNGCSSLTNITIPNSVTSIGYFAFGGCDSLTSITIPDSVTSIGNCAFYNCSSLTGDITIPDGVTSIDSSTFFDCRSLTSITIPDSVTIIDGCAFYNCDSLKSVTMPNRLTRIGNEAFSSCRSLTSITIPNGVTIIESYAFSGCRSLTSITIPNSVTYICTGAFNNCSGVTDVYYSGTEEEWKKNCIDNYDYDIAGATIHFDNSATETTTETPTVSVIYSDFDDEAKIDTSDSINNLKFKLAVLTISILLLLFLEKNND